MMRAIVLAGALLAFTACSTAPEPATAPAPSTQASPPPSSPAPSPAPAADACGAARHQHLVGRPRSEIPIPVKPELQRVACTTCPVTMDFNQHRLNFFFDAGTGLIKEVRCG